MAFIGRQFGVLIPLMLVALACTPATAPSASPGVTPTAVPPATATPGTPTASPGATATASPSTPPTASPEPTPSTVPPTASPEPTASAVPPTASPSPTGTPLPTPTPEPMTTVTSEDGNFWLTVPTQGIPAGVKLKVVKRGPDKLPPEITGAGLTTISFYDLGPDGTTFTRPVTIWWRYPTSVFAGHVRLSALAVRNSKGKWEWVNHPQFLVNDDFTYLTGDISHFTDVYAFGDFTEISTGAVRHNWETGTPQDITWDLKNPSTAAHPMTFVNEPIRSVTPPGTILETNDVLSSDRTHYATTNTCTQLGPISVAFTALVDNFGADAAFYTSTLKLPALDITAGRRFDINCVEPGTGNFATINQICLQVTHKKLGVFLSYIAFGMVLIGDDIDYIEVTLRGANDDQPQKLKLTDEGYWEEKFGLHGTGDTTIINVTVHWKDRSTEDITQDVIADLGTDTFTVRFPEEDSLGVCPLG